MQGHSALDLWNARGLDVLTLPLGCEAIDNLLDGGFRSGILTEICGEASAGKTQMCLQLLLQSCLPKELGGLGGTACYICTEGVSPIKRLHELAESYHERYGAILRKRRRVGSRDQDSSSDLTATAFLDAIFIEQVYEVDELVEVVQTRLPTLLAEHNTKLVVIDSIAAVFRLESTNSIKDASERSRLMFHLANCMRILSAQFQVVFVISNQVTGNVTDGSSVFTPQQSAAQFKPALGLSWSHCINQRLMLHRPRHRAERRLEVVFSPYLANETAVFQITGGGISSVERNN